MMNNESITDCIKFYDSTGDLSVSMRAKALTPSEREKLFLDGSIISIAKPISDLAAKNIMYEKREATTGLSGVDQPANIAAVNEILALGEPLGHGAAYKVIRRLNAHAQTVYKMLYRVRKSSLPQRRKHVIQEWQAKAIVEGGR